MSFLWDSEAFVDAMGGRPIGDMPEGITGISIDSRSIAPGEAFFAIKGENFDGHSFASAAMANGASVLVVSEAKLPSLGRLKVPMVVVDDVLAALGRLAMAARKRTGAQVIAVTGSAGKTTTKEMLRAMLSRSGSVHASEKSFNNHWGVPLTVARLPADADFAVFEIGMNHSGEIAELVKFAQPHIAIITVIAPAHLGNFKSIDDIARAKAEIFGGVVPGGYAVINRDDQKYRLLDKLAQEAEIDKVVTFGESQRSTNRLMEYLPHPGGARFTVKVDGKLHSGDISVAGKHLMANALAALSACQLAGADIGRAIAALATLESGKGRGERHVLRHSKGGRFVVIDESYNANPTSMEAAIRVLADTPVTTKGRRMAVLGDMRELGRFSEKLHAGLADALVGSGIDRAFLGGPEMKALADALAGKMTVEYRETTEALAPVVVKAVHAGDAVMIKSSNGTGFSKIVDALLKAYERAPATAAGARTAEGEQDARTSR